MDKYAPLFCQFYFWFGSNPKTIYLFVELSFLASSWYTLE